jgi:hypothetical protein
MLEFHPIICSPTWDLLARFQKNKNDKHIPDFYMVTQAIVTHNKQTGKLNPNFNIKIDHPGNAMLLCLN